MPHPMIQLPQSPAPQRLVGIPAFVLDTARELVSNVRGFAFSKLRRKKTRDNCVDVVFVAGPGGSRAARHSRPIRVNSLLPRWSPGPGENQN